MKPVGIALIPALVIVLIVVLLPTGTMASSSVRTTLDDQVSLAITIYNEGTGLVKDTRVIDLPEDYVDLVFMDVASQIDPTSVHFISNTDPDSIAVMEQNYEYDLVSTQALYERHIDQPVTVITSDNRTIEGTLLSYSGGLVISTGNGIVIVNDPVEVMFEDIPEGLITRPTLRWQLISDDDGTNECEMSYLTSGMGWTANYVAVVGEDDDEIDLAGWVTIDNNSGTTYREAELKLVAGDVHRVDYIKSSNEYPTDEECCLGMGVGGGFEEESFFEYHLYTLQRPATLNNNQQKQINLLEGEGVAAVKLFIFDPGGSYYYSGDSVEGDVLVKLRFTNSEDNGLGIPLPRGLVRVYKEDSSGSLQFVGEDQIDHTPKDEELELYLGEAFDVVGERTVMDRRQVMGNQWEYDVRITIRNHKDEDIEVVYFDHVYGDWEVTESSHEYEQKDASTIEFVIPVEADDESVLEFTIRRNW